MKLEEFVEKYEEEYYKMYDREDKFNMSIYTPYNLFTQFQHYLEHRQFKDKTFVPVFYLKDVAQAIVPDSDGGIGTEVEFQAKLGVKFFDKITKEEVAVKATLNL